MNVGLGRRCCCTFNEQREVREGRNPKSEGRKKAEVRRPKARRAYPGSHHFREQMGARYGPQEHSVPVDARQASGFGLRFSAFFRVSVFGLRICAPHGSTYTGIPIQTSLSRYSAFQFASRKQPWDSVRPTCSGLGVP